MTRRNAILLVIWLTAVLFVPDFARAQFATPNTAGTNGGSCTSGYAWPDSGGHALVCSSGTWQLVNDTIWSPSGSNIYFNGGNVGIGTTAPTTALQVGSTPGTGTSCNISSTGVLTNCTWNGLALTSTYLPTATTSVLGIASFNSTNFTVTSGAVNTIQNINTTATPQFARIGLGTAADGTAGIIDTQTAIGTTSTDGVILQNPTAATSTVNQWSPRVHWTAQGWKTTSTAGSQAVDMIQELQPVTGAANPSGNLVWSSSVNGGTYSGLMTLTTGGNVGIGTTAPLQPLEVTGNVLINGNDSAGELMLGTCCQSTLYRAASDGSLHIVSAQANIDLTPTSNVIVTQGNVGIGVTNPQSLLAVNANGSFTNGPSAFVANASTTLASTLDALNYVAEFQGPALGNLNRLLLLQHRTAAGSGWQTVAWRLQPAVDASFTGVNSNVGYVELSYGTSGSYRGIGLSGAGNTAPDLVVNSSGNVGIGTTAPAANGLTINSGTPTLTFELSGTSEESLYDDGSYFYVMSTSGGNGVKLQHGATLWTSSSDWRIKKDIAALPESYGLSAVERLKPVTYHWRDPKSPRQLQMGLIAQDVQEVIPELVTRSAPTRYAPDGELGIEYSGLVIPLIKAVQELKGDNDNLRREFEAYKAAHP
jgi:endosialidase-like protein